MTKKQDKKRSGQSQGKKRAGRPKGAKQPVRFELYDTDLLRWAFLDELHKAEPNVLKTLIEQVGPYWQQSGLKEADYGVWLDAWARIKSSNDESLPAPWRQLKLALRLWGQQWSRRYDFTAEWILGAAFFTLAAPGVSGGAWTMPGGGGAILKPTKPEPFAPRAWESAHETDQAYRREMVRHLEQHLDEYLELWRNKLEQGGAVPAKERRAAHHMRWLALHALKPDWDEFIERERVSDESTIRKPAQSLAEKIGLVLVANRK